MVGLSCLPQAAHACRTSYQPVLGGRPPRPLVAALTCRVLVEGCCWGQCSYPGRPPKLACSCSHLTGPGGGQGQHA